MSLFHRHRWREIKRYAVPAYGGKFNAEGFGAAEVLEEALHGFTVIELKCEECGEISERRLPGDAT